IIYPRPKCFFLYAQVTILSSTSSTTSLRRAALTLANVEQNRSPLTISQCHHHLFYFVHGPCTNGT
ncbi:MAG: hypothetical protein II431_12115, partial [Prevotella sp.]|nr:hypothetical protein [Prevotella sp.]